MHAMKSQIKLPADLFCSEDPLSVHRNIGTFLQVYSYEKEQGSSLRPFIRAPGLFMMVALMT